MWSWHYRFVLLILLNKDKVKVKTVFLILEILELCNKICGEDAADFNLSSILK